MIKRMAKALLIGAVAAIGLELLNGVCTFLLPPLIVITPTCLIVAMIVVVLSHGVRQSDRCENAPRAAVGGRLERPKPARR